LIDTPRILIVDDQESFRDTYVEILSREGYDAIAVAHEEEAEDRLRNGEWDVVLVDQKLLGAGGPNDGLDLLARAADLAPGVKAIMVTAYASDEAVTAAFERGAYDYLEKGARFKALLLAKVRNAVEATSRLRLARAGEQEIGRLWDAVRNEADPHRKGALLEALTVLLFRSIPGFEHISLRRRNDIEEIDVWIRNQSGDPFWQKESAYLLVECKHWTRPVDREVADVLRGKMRRKFGRCRLGVLMAPGGVTEPLREALHHAGDSDDVVLLLEGEALDRFVRTADRELLLKDAHERAVLTANGAVR